jgi:hypothetical protein
MVKQVYTASLLKEGLVAYLCLENGTPTWVSDIRQATAGADEELEFLKRAAEKAEQENLVVAPYAIDVAGEARDWNATTKREQIRSAGPTINLPRDRSPVSDSAGLQAA